jgi:hypothetical protein
MTSLAQAGRAQSGTPPHAWLFGTWTGGLFPAPTNITAEACLAQPVVIFTRDVVLRAVLTDQFYAQRAIETVRTTPKGAEIQFIPAPGAGTNPLLGINAAAGAVGFGCENGDVLHVERHGQNEITFPAAATSPTRWCAARRAEMRIALIHALRHSIAPVAESFARLWPEARLANLLDDSLSADLARDGKLTEAMTERFLTLARYVRRSGADGILFTCSAFGPCIEAVARSHAPIPVLKPNEAMIEQAVARGRRIGLLSTFAPTLASMPPEFPTSVEVVPKLAEGALAALDRGDRATHDRLVAEAARDLRDCDLIALAQYSMAPAAAQVAQATRKTVLTTPDSAVEKLKSLLQG